MTDSCTAVSSHPTSYYHDNNDNEITALTLQLEEIEIYSQKAKGKYAVDRPPDSAIACASFQSELQAYRIFRADQVLARSIAAAVHADGPIIAHLTAQEVQSREDRLFALRTSDADPGCEQPSSITNSTASIVGSRGLSGTHS